MWWAGRKQQGCIYLSDEGPLVGQLEAALGAVTSSGQSLEHALHHNATHGPVTIWLSACLAPALDLPEGFDLLKPKARREVLEELALAALGTSAVVIRLDVKALAACAMRQETAELIRAASQGKRLRVQQVLPAWASDAIRPNANERTALIEGQHLTTLEQQPGRLVVRTQSVPASEQTAALTRWRIAASLAQVETRLWAVNREACKSASGLANLFQEVGA